MRQYTRVIMGCLAGHSPGDSTFPTFSRARNPSTTGDLSSTFRRHTASSSESDGLGSTWPTIPTPRRNSDSTAPKVPISISTFAYIGCHIPSMPNPKAVHSAARYAWICGAGSLDATPRRRACWFSTLLNTMVEIESLNAVPSCVIVWNAAPATLCS